MSAKDIASYVFLAVTWGLSFLVLVRAAAAFGWIGAVSFRCFIAAATLFAVAALTRRRMNFSIGWMPFIIVGATTVVGQLVGLSYGTPIIGTAMAAILVASIPLFSMLIAKLWGLEQITPQGLLGLALGIGGIVLLVGFPPVPFTADFALGCAAVLLSCVSAAFGGCYASSRLRGVSAWDVTAGAFLAGGLMTLPLIGLVPVPTTPTLTDFGYLILLGSLMSATTYVVYFRLVSTIGATRAVSVEFAVTVVAVFIGAVVLKEPLTAVQVVGAVVIMVGCALVTGLVPRFTPKRL